MPQPFKIEKLLSREELDELERFSREPGRTVDETHEWFVARNLTISRGAVGRWLRRFKEDHQHEKFGASGNLSRALIQLDADPPPTMSRRKRKDIERLVRSSAKLLRDSLLLRLLPQVRAFMEIELFLKAQKSNPGVTDEGSSKAV